MMFVRIPIIVNYVSKIIILEHYKLFIFMPKISIKTIKCILLFILIIFCNVFFCSKVVKKMYLSKTLSLENTFLCVYIYFS